MKHILFIAIGFIYLTFSQVAIGQQHQEPQNCDNKITQSVGKYFDIDNFSYPPDGLYPSAENGGLIVASACKQWPSDQAKLITAFAYDSGDARKIDDPFVYLLVAIVDLQKNEVISTYKSKYYLDPGGVESLKIDTAPYHLSSNTTAFGLDIESGYSHNCGDGGLGAERTLYIQNNHRLRPIFTLTMSYWSFIQEGQSRCNSTADDSEITIIEKTNLYIGISPSSTHGFNDLLISAINTRNDNKPSKRKPFHFKLRFDGEKYPTQELHNKFEKWAH